MKVEEIEQKQKQEQEQEQEQEQVLERELSEDELDLDGTDHHHLQKSIFLRWNFYRSMWTYCLATSFIGSIIIYVVDDIAYIDALFLSISAYTGSGLATVEMSAVSNKTFIVLYVMMNLGGIIFLLLPPMIYRILAFNALQPELEVFLSKLELPYSPQTQKLIWLVGERRAQVRGLRMVVITVAAYILVIMGCGIGILYGTLSVRPNPPELEERGLGKLWNAVFLVSSAFCNCGFTLTSDSVYWMKTWPECYLLLCFLILAGNNLAPILLRGFVRLVHFLAGQLKLDRGGLRYALDHSRQMTTHLLDKGQTRVLIIILVAINTFQFIAFLSSSLQREELLEGYGATAMAGAGFFQTISTRSAGLQIFDLNHLNQGMHIIYILMMYLSAAPFVSRMYVSEQTLDSDGRSVPTVSSVHAAKARFQSQYLFRHLSFLLFAFLLLAFIHDPRAYKYYVLQPFPILFELVSAYGNVGLSLGVPGKNFSLCGAFSVLGKLIIICAMLLGKHRGLPAHTDLVLNFRHTRLKRQLALAKEEEGLPSEWRWSAHKSRKVVDMQAIQEGEGEVDGVLPPPLVVPARAKSKKEGRHVVIMAEGGKPEQEEEEGAENPQRHDDGGHIPRKQTDKGIRHSSSRRGEQHKTSFSHRLLSRLDPSPKLSFTRPKASPPTLPEQGMGAANMEDLELQLDTSFTRRNRNRTQSPSIRSSDAVDPSSLAVSSVSSPVIEARDKRQGLAGLMHSAWDRLWTPAMEDEREKIQVEDLLTSDTFFNRIYTQDLSFHGLPSASMEEGNAHHVENRHASLELIRRTFSNRTLVRQHELSNDIDEDAMSV
ncbi:hypothetical protein GUITHDRAFT_109699 [Guillardia theta CCMP2712]|uniref:Uncharacterized protein n=1 Tax=Guillardia theta (strain CCMP2712) TaxID=905079 RepID=L1J842_GUITC|nr:hypothetical protein GUITHDRAFT_109699 [Guillardia theta CCMP2712]EKX44240.1 hypothetical protein GUITHDRAFT_109699 [Guillardia theta CCMP2712]|eukprot:XP_005831220.1 hypothetical protein GUITHDRAFT_109699 [Guillardia theta CCMP2712]